MDSCDSFSLLSSSSLSSTDSCDSFSLLSSSLLFSIDFCDSFSLLSPTLHDPSMSSIALSSSSDFCSPQLISLPTSNAICPSCGTTSFSTSIAQNPHNIFSQASMRRSKLMSRDCTANNIPSFWCWLGQLPG